MEAIKLKTTLIPAHYFIHNIGSKLIQIYYDAKPRLFANSCEGWWVSKCIKFPLINITTLQKQSLLKQKQLISMLNHFSKIKIKLGQKYRKLVNLQKVQIPTPEKNRNKYFETPVTYSQT